MKSSEMPTFCRSTELKICPDSAELADALATNGRFSPTTIVASSLSAVSRVGADNTLLWVSLCRAVINAISHGTTIGEDDEFWPVLTLIVLAVAVAALVAALTAALTSVPGIEQLLPEASPIPRPVKPRGLPSEFWSVPKF